MISSIVPDIVFQVTFDNFEDVNDRVKVGFHFSEFVQNGVTCMWISLMKCFHGMLTLLTPWLVIFLLCGCFTILDQKSHNDGKQKCAVYQRIISISR